MFDIGIITVFLCTQNFLVISFWRYAMNREADLDNDGAINYEEFANMCHLAKVNCL